MEPHRFGRKLGIGVRVASRMAKERAAKASAASATQAATAQATTAPPPQSRPAHTTAPAHAKKLRRARPPRR